MGIWSRVVRVNEFLIKNPALDFLATVGIISSVVTPLWILSGKNPPPRQPSELQIEIERRRAELKKKREAARDNSMEFKYGAFSSPGLYAYNLAYKDPVSKDGAGAGAGD